MSKYIEVVDANSYFLTRLYTRDWDEAEADNQSKSLEQATRIIDRLNFVGDKTDPDQELQFPRGGDIDVPIDIQMACCEIAYALLSGVDPEIEFANLDVNSSNYGSVKTTFDRSRRPEHVLAGVPSIVAWRYLLPYLRDPRHIAITRV